MSSKLDGRALLEQVRTNLGRLDGCPRHDFQPLEGDGRVIMKRYRCRACGGEVDSSAVLWYQRGLEHAAAGR